MSTFTENQTTRSLTLASPGEKILGHIEVGLDNQVFLSVSRGEQTVIERSLLGLTVDGCDLGRNLTMGEPLFDSINETYPTRGWHTLAHNHCTTCHIPFVHDPTGTAWALELRAFDDGLAYRYIVAGNRARTVNGEASSWTIPAGSKVWIAERNNDWKLKSYAGWWTPVDLAALPSISSEGPVQAPPLVIELPGGGYTVLLEAALANYSGMRLRAVGHRRVQVDFTEGETGFVIEGCITTPWRVTLACPDLNGLVNSDILTNLNPPPDPGLFADQSFIKLGRVTWRWWSSGTGTPEQERQYVDYAHALGFEHSLIDDGWEAWPAPWQSLTNICSYAKSIGVGVFVWKDYKDLSDPSHNYAQLRTFLDGITEAGTSGVKIDFMNAESKDRIDFQMAALRETASRRLMLLFHGCQKPSGESRTWPHEVTREGIRGLELNKMKEGPIYADHNAALPFTRYLAGHADYTPVGYSNPGDTTWAHQLATAIIFTSPLNVIAENPDVLLNNPDTLPALDLLKDMPSIWDETRVLEPSAIGKIAVFARRIGTTWYVGAINGTQREQRFPLDLSFLGSTKYHATILTSPTPHAFERRELEGISSASLIKVHLQRVDGWVARFVV